MATLVASSVPHAGKRAWRWPAIVLGLLLLQIGTSALMIYVATSDASFAVEPDYYRKAVEWDQRAAQLRAEQALGWRITFDLSADADALQRRLLTARVFDAQQQPLRGASLRVRAFHHARAADALEASLHESAPGEYRVALPLMRAGLWEFRFELTSASRIFSLRELRELAAPAKAAPATPKATP